ncbi:MAG TPA: hypothetical protein VKQ36_17105, partial [Ktedonobacterales bacterium]|nr:hypothetical protein [Ktedonobacterales bacterium]
MRQRTPRYWIAALIFVLIGIAALLLFLFFTFSQGGSIGAPPTGATTGNPGSGGSPTLDYVNLAGLAFSG